MSINYLIKVMILLWKSGVLNSLTLIQFLQNASTQYGVMVTTNAGSSNLAFTVEPSMLVKPLLTIVGTGFNFLFCVKDTSEFQKWVAIVAVFASSSPLVPLNKRYEVLIIFKSTQLKLIYKNDKTNFIISNETIT